MNSHGSVRVSVCIPTYNSSAFVGETIESVLAQDHSSFELVIADHGSTDSTVDILRRYADDSRVRLVLGSPGGGAQANWNRATDLAQGEYIKLVCADDPLYADCLSRQAEVLDENPGVVLVASKRDIVDAQGRVVYRGRGLGGLQGRVDGPSAVRRSVQLGTNIFGEPSSVLMRASAMRAAGAWSDALPYLIDEDMYVRVLRHGDFYALPSSLATFRLSTTSWSLALAREQAAQHRAFHQVVRRAYPVQIRFLDVLRGGLWAEANAWARRLVYLMMRRRLRVPAPVPAATERSPQ